MHILISPNAFKNSIDAATAARAIEEGFHESLLKCTTTCFPIGDGGDGTGSLITQLCGGILIMETVHDSLGRKIEADIGLVDNGQTAVIEMADASGLRLLTKEERDPLHASSYGTGELIIKALDQNVNKIILCIGGSATVDGGCGILQALGIRFLDKDQQEIKNLPENLTDLFSFDLSALDKRILQCECIILCDVSNTLLGENGCAKIFGPQKGADGAMVEQLERSLTQFNAVVQKEMGIDMSLLKYGGAAGGVAAALSAFIQAKPVNGIDHFLDLTGFDKALESTNLLITGEGSIDLQTLEGKGPYGVAARAKQKNIPVIALAGKIPGEPSAELNRYFQRLININRAPTSTETAIRETAYNLSRTAKELGDEMARASVQ